MNTLDPPPDLLDPLRAAAPVPGRHPRDEVMERAGDEFMRLFQSLIVKYGMSSFEYLYLISILQRGLIQGLCLAERENAQKEVHGG